MRGILVYAESIDEDPNAHNSVQNRHGVHDGTFHFSNEDMLLVEQTDLAAQPYMRNSIVQQRHSLDTYRRLARHFASAVSVAIFAYKTAQHIAYPDGTTLLDVQNEVSSLMPMSMRIAQYLHAPFVIMGRMTTTARLEITFAHPFDLKDTDHAQHEYYEFISTPGMYPHQQPMTKRVRPTGSTLLALAGFIEKLVDYDTFVDDALRSVPATYLNETGGTISMNIQQFRQLVNIPSPTRPVPDNPMDDYRLNHPVTSADPKYVVLCAISSRLQLPIQSTWFMTARGAYAFDMEFAQRQNETHVAFPATLRQIQDIYAQFNEPGASTQGALGHFEAWSQSRAVAGIYPVNLEVARWYVQRAPQSTFSLMMNCWRRLMNASTGDWTPYRVDYGDAEVTNAIVLPRRETTKPVGAVRRQREEI